ncbi:hypothetical protein [Geopseudomonas aromaticivorans]
MKRSETEQQATRLYTVHADIEVRAKVVGIEATSMLEAAQTADEVDLGGALFGSEFDFGDFKALEVSWACGGANAFTVDPVVDGAVDYARTRTVTPEPNGLLDLPGAQGPMEAYAVHVFTDVRVTFSSIEASSPEEAARKIGEGDFDLHELLRRGQSRSGGVEIAEVEYTESAPSWYLVDPLVNGKSDYENSVELDGGYQRIVRAHEPLPEALEPLTP